MAYAVIADVRAVDSSFFTEIKYADSVIQEGLDIATELIDTYCGTSFEYKTFTAKCLVNNTGWVTIPVTNVQTITGATTNTGVVLNTATWLPDEYDRVFITGIQPTGIYSNYYAANYINVTGTAGSFVTCPISIKVACKTLAAAYVKNLVRAIPMNTSSFTNEYGTTALLQPNDSTRPTAYPEINAILNRYKLNTPAAW